MYLPPPHLFLHKTVMLILIPTIGRGCLYAELKECFFLHGVGLTLCKLKFQCITSTGKVSVQLLHR